MRKLTVSFIILGLAALCASVLTAGVTTVEWKKAKKKFQKVFKSGKRIKAVKELGAIEDVRAAKHLVKEALYHDGFDVYEAAHDCLADTKEPESLAFIAGELSSEKKAGRRVLLAKLLARLPKDPGVAKSVKFALMDRKAGVILPGIRAAVIQGGDANVKYLRKLLSSKNRRVAFETAAALAVIEGKWPKDFKAVEKGDLLPKKINAGSVVFLIDTSEQMLTKFRDPDYKPEKKPKEDKKKKPRRKKDKNKGEKKKGKPKIVYTTRLELVKRRIKAALGTVDKHAVVSLVAFGQTSEVFSKKPVRTSKKNLKAINAWMDSLEILRRALGRDRRGPRQDKTRHAQAGEVYIPEPARGRGACRERPGQALGRGQGPTRGKARKSEEVFKAARGR
jgi:hypothetical protein